MLEFFAQLDKHLLAVVHTHGGWTYVLLFGVLTCEVGLVFTPFVPGETLLFAAGTLAATKTLNLPLLLVGFTAAALAGNVSGYTIGRLVRARAGSPDRMPKFCANALATANTLYAKNPVRTIVFSRFVPIVRALAPFVAGLAEMPLRPFLLFSTIGGALWAFTCTLAGYAFGHVPLVRENFTLALVTILIASTLPSLYTYARRSR